MAFSQLRRPKEEGQMSTAEAVACALQSLGCSQISTAIFHAIQFATEQELRSRAKDS
jgi:DTW domain-containing protein YfiP